MYRASRSPSASSPADRNTVLTSAAGAEHTAKPSDMHSTDMTHLRGPSGSTRFLRLRAGPRRRRPIGPVWRLNSARKKVIGRLKEGFSEILRRGTLATYEIFGQSNLSWLASSMVPLHGRGKDLVAGTASLPMARAHLSEGRENNFCQSHTSWLTSLGFLLPFEAQLCPDANRFQTAGQEKQSHQLHTSWLTGRGLTIHTQLSSPCPKLVSEARLFRYHLRTANNF